MKKEKILKITSGMLLCTMALYTAPVMAFTKDETVYSKMDSAGNSYKTIVTDHIKNQDDEKSLNDISDLLDIVNLNGDEKFTRNGNDLVWAADGNDIYYQGTSEKKLPIVCNIKYELDGKEIDSQDLIGKSGEVKITLEFENTDKHVTNINGENVTLYTPFVMACGTVFNNDNCKNIKVSSGKAINDGTKTTVVGIALPGMQESLGISGSKVKIPDSVTITMDSENFEMNNILIYATPKLIEDSDLNLVDNINEIFEAVNTLKASSDKIEDGANKLSEGTSTLQNGVSELNTGADSLATGATTLKNGTSTFKSKSHEFNNAVNELSTGTSEINTNYSKIESGANELNSGVSTLTSALSSMPGSISQLYNGTSSVVSGLNGDGTAANPGLVNGINSMADSLTTTTSGLETALTNIISSSNSSIALLNANNTSLNTVLSTLDPSVQGNEETISALNAQIVANNSAISQFQAAKTEAETKLSAVQLQATSGASSINALKTGATTIQSAMTQINGGLGQLNSAAGSLPENLNKLSEGSQNLASGSTALKGYMNSLDTNTKKLVSANNQLTSGADSLANGASELATGASKLSTGTSQLSSGVSELNTGASTLATGINKFNVEGINKIYNFVNGDLKDVSLRIEKLKDLADEYRNFTMLNDSDDGSVKFIMIIDSLKADKKNENEKAFVTNDKH